jgi:hypothetical protein
MKKNTYDKGIPKKNSCLINLFLILHGSKKIAFEL